MCPASATGAPYLESAGPAEHVGPRHSSIQRYWVQQPHGTQATHTYTRTQPVRCHADTRGVGGVTATSTARGPKTEPRPNTPGQHHGPWHHPTSTLFYASTLRRTPNSQSRGGVRGGNGRATRPFRPRAKVTPRAPKGPRPLRPHRRPLLAGVTALRTSCGDPPNFRQEAMASPSVMWRAVSSCPSPLAAVRRAVAGVNRLSTSPLALHGRAPTRWLSTTPQAGVDACDAYDVMCCLGAHSSPFLGLSALCVAGVVSGAVQSPPPALYVRTPVGLGADSALILEPRPVGACHSSCAVFAATPAASQVEPVAAVVSADTGLATGAHPPTTDTSHTPPSPPPLPPPIHPPPLCVRALPPPRPLVGCTCAHPSLQRHHPQLRPLRPRTPLLVAPPWWLLTLLLRHPKAAATGTTCCQRWVC
jgi:hypothetical protein